MPWLRSLTNVPVHIAVFDVRDNRMVMKMHTELPDEFKKIDVLVNSAGLALGMQSGPRVRIWATGRPWSIPISKASCI